MSKLEQAVESIAQAADASQKFNSPASYFQKSREIDLTTATKIVKLPLNKCQELTLYGWVNDVAIEEESDLVVVEILGADAENPFGTVTKRFLFHLVGEIRSVALLQLIKDLLSGDILTNPTCSEYNLQKFNF